MLQYNVCSRARTWIGSNKLDFSMNVMPAPLVKHLSLIKKTYTTCLRWSNFNDHNPLLKMTSWIGGFLLTISAVSNSFMFYRYFFTNKVEVQGWASSMILILFLFGVLYRWVFRGNTLAGYLTK